MPEAKSRHIDYRPDEYISGVAAKLTAEEQGVYWMICSLIMSHGGPIDNDPMHVGRLTCLSKTRAKRIIEKLLLIGKITENGSLLGQKRAEKEVKSAIKRIEKSQENGAKGGRPRKENNNLEKPTGLSGEKLTTNTPTHQPSTHKENLYKISLKDGTDFLPTPEDIQLWGKTFPHANTDREFLKMQTWLDANPSKRKTRRGAKAFISGWLSRAHDNSSHVERPASRAPSSGTPEADAIELAAYGKPFNG